MGNCLPIFRCFDAAASSEPIDLREPLTINIEDSGADDGDEVISYAGKLNKVEKLHCSSNQVYQLWKQKQQVLPHLSSINQFTNSSSDLIGECFAPLSTEDKRLLLQWFHSIGKNVSVIHKNTNIHITPENSQCLLPRKWLNDEVVNVYLSLLKEREERDPEMFRRCHFFSSFFFVKLGIKGTGYDYRSVRRWTDPNRLGYNLLDCEMCFVPINRERHWSLGIINITEKKFQYLDSLGRDDDDDGVLNLLARYFVDEAKDKTGDEADVSRWKRQVVKRLPRQENGYDCGVFMIKYADFISRYLDPIFDQRHIDYFRWRTALEIVKLRAD